MLSAYISMYLMMPVLGALFNVVFRKFRKISFFMTLFILTGLLVNSYFIMKALLKIKEYSYVFEVGLHHLA